jgi:hypothetical protein
MKEVLGRVERLIKQGVRDKQIRPEAADLAPMLFVGMVRAVCIRDILADRQQRDFSAEADQLIEIFLHGVGK